MDQIYIEYGGYFYVPMTQAFSLAIPVTIGCSWDKCLYCDLNHNNKFRKLAIEEIEAHILRLKELTPSAKRPVERVVLAGGNPLCLNTSTLIEIIQLVKDHFPQVKNISSFARADDILRKSDDDLLELKSHGMGELSIGIESGNDEILAFHHKGVTAEDNYKTMAKLEELDISYSTYIMLGLGGKKLSEENAIDTGKMLSNFNPQVISLVSLVLFKDAKIIEKVKTREFIKLKPLEYIYEERLLLENLNMRNTIFNGTHKTNTLVLKGKLPDHKEILLKKIDEFLEANDDRSLKDFEKGKWIRWSIE